MFDARCVRAGGTGGTSLLVDGDRRDTLARCTLQEALDGRVVVGSPAQIADQAKVLVPVSTD